MHKKCSIFVFTACVFYGLFFFNTAGDVLAGDSEHRHNHMHGNHSGMHATADVPVIEFKAEPEKIHARAPAILIFSVKDSKGSPAKDLSITHERIMHVVIISEDFSVFSHIHPEDSGPINGDMLEKARFPVRYTFPKGGRYVVAVDCAVKGALFSKQFFVDVEGMHKMGASQKDLSRDKIFGQYTVTLSSSPKNLSAGDKATLNFLIRKNGAPVKDLEPYLAAPMHIAIIMSDLNRFLHAHGGAPGAASADHPTAHIHGVSDKYGPDIEAQVVFPEKGLYKIFGEIKHNGRVITTDFMVEVK